MKPEEIKQILIEHKKWLNSDDGGKRADFFRANLYGADLSRANLSGADLYGANLSGADLRGADLRGANLYQANLSGANLSEANLSGADLYGADLSRANLSGVNLYGAYLSEANLSRADLSKGDILFTFLTCKWWITYNAQNPKPLQIGCESKTIEEWDAWFDSDKEYETKRDSKEFEMIRLSYNHAKNILKESI